MISDTVKFLLNDELVVIKNPDPNQTLLNYIRTELKKTGTKEGCSEGLWCMHYCFGRTSW